MASPFEAVILRLNQLGFYQFFLPFMLTSAIFYGALRKSQIFGDPEKNIAVNAVISIVASMMVWSAPVILGLTDFQTQLATFFVQGLSATLVIMVSLMVVGMFAPQDLSKYLAEKLGRGYLGVALVIGLIIGLGIFISSGLVNIFIPGGIGGVGGLDQDTTTLIVFAALLVITVIFIVGGGAITKKS